MTEKKSFLEFNFMSDMQGRSQRGTTGPNFQGPGFRGARIFDRKFPLFLIENPLYSKILLLKVSTFYLRALRGILRLFSCPPIHQELLCVPQAQQKIFSGPPKCSEFLKTYLHPLNVPSQNCIRPVWALLCPIRKYEPISRPCIR